MYKDINANDEYFTQRAIARKKMMDAYCEQGFTREEAMVFMIDSDIMMKNAMKNISTTSTKSNKK